MRLARLIALCLILAFCPLPAWGTPADEKFFEEKVRPVLVEHCFSCHGAEKQKSGLRLDSREAMLKGGKGGLVFDADKPGESRLLLAIRHTDADLQMPPDAKLPGAKMEGLERWGKMGAPWPATAQMTPLGRSKK